MRRIVRLAAGAVAVGVVAASTMVPAGRGSAVVAGKLAFVSGRAGFPKLEIYVANPDGSGQTDLSNHAGADTSPAWSADGSKLAFVSDRDGNAEIYVMNVDGSRQTRLTTNRASEE